MPHAASSPTPSCRDILSGHSGQNPATDVPIPDTRPDATRAIARLQLARPLLFHPTMRTPLESILWFAALAAAVGEPVDLDRLTELLERLIAAERPTASA